MTENRYEQGEGPAAEGSQPAGEVTQEDIQAAMATYSGDGQNDDLTGGDALAEVWQERGADEPERPSPDTHGAI